MLPNMALRPLGWRFVWTSQFKSTIKTDNIEEAFADGMNEKIAETEDAVKKGIEKPGVQIHAENAVKSGFIEDLRKHWRTI